MAGTDASAAKGGQRSTNANDIMPGFGILKAAYDAMLLASGQADNVGDKKVSTATQYTWYSYFMLTACLTLFCVKNTSAPQVSFKLPAAAQKSRLL